MGSSKARRNRLNGDDGGLLSARPPFSFIRYWGKIFLGVVLLACSVITLFVFNSRLKTQHGGTADFVRLIVLGMCGAIALVGVLFIRWAFAEEGRSQ